MTVGAVVFDFNGTLSNDEPILCEIFRELFAEHGKPLSAQEYFDHLAGLSDPEIVRTWLGEDHPDVDAVIEERIVRYRAACADGSIVSRSRPVPRFDTRRSASPSRSCPELHGRRSNPSSRRPVSPRSSRRS